MFLAWFHILLYIILIYLKLKVTFRSHPIPFFFFRFGRMAWPARWTVKMKAVGPSVASQASHRFCRWCATMHVAMASRMKMNNAPGWLGDSAFWRLWVVFHFFWSLNVGFGFWVKQWTVGHGQRLVQTAPEDVSQWPNDSGRFTWTNDICWRAWILIDRHIHGCSSQPLCSLGGAWKGWRSGFGHATHRLGHTCQT